MRIIKKVLCLGILFSFISVQAQDFDLGKVSVKELEEKSHPTDSSAAAAVLFNKGRTSFNYSDSKGFYMVTEVETRVKIYSKEGYDWANKSVEFYSGSNPAEQVAWSKAITYNIVGGKIEKTKLKNDGEFSEKMNKFWSVAKITMPNVKEGSVIEYKYTITSPYTSTFPEWKFQNKIPVNYSEYTTEVPEYYNYKSFGKGALSPVTSRVSRNGFIMMTSKERPQGNNSTPGIISNDKISYRIEVIKYILEEIPALKEEAYVNNIDNYSSAILHELASTKFPNSTEKLFATDWESIVKTIYLNEDFGGELNKKNYFEEDLKILTAEISDKKQKLVTIFEYVKNRMNWNNYTGYYCNDGVKKAYKEKTGNIAEINLMLASMLQTAGFQARPVLVSTRANGVAIAPNKSAYNYVIVAVEDDNTIVLLDATDKYALPNQIPFRALNWFGRLIREDGSSVMIDLMPKEASKEVNVLSYSVSGTGEIAGKIRKQHSEYNAQIFRNRYYGLKEEQYLEKLENDSGIIDISEYVRSNADEFYKPVQESYSFTGNGLCDLVGDKIYLSPMLFLSTTKNPFNQEKRAYPVDFGFPSQDKYTINIEIPDGYVVESIPASAQMETEQNICSFKYIIQEAGNKIQLSITQDVFIPIVNPVDYPVLQESYKKIIEKQNEKIVLKKI